MKDDDFKLLVGFADRQTNKQTFLIVESLLRLKNDAHVASVPADEVNSFEGLCLG